jgi:hypothetical protein
VVGCVARAARRVVGRVSRAARRVVGRVAVETMRGNLESAAGLSSHHLECDEPIRPLFRGRIGSR